MSLVVLFIKYSRAYMFVAIGLGVLGGVSSAMLMATVNSRLAGAATTLNSGWIFIGLVATVLITNFATRVIMSNLAQWSLCDLRMHMVRLILSTPLRTLENAGAHRVFASLTADIDDIARVFGSVPVVCIDIAILIAGFAYLAHLSFPLFLVLVVFLVFAIWTSKLPEFRALRMLAAARDHWEQLLRHFRAVTDGAKELKLHAARRHAFLGGPLFTAASSYRAARFAGESMYAFAKAWGVVMYFVFVGVCLYVMPRFDGYQPVVLFGYILTLLYMKGSLDRVQDLLPTYGQGQIALKRIMRLGLSMDQLASALTAPKRRSLSRNLDQEPKLRQGTIAPGRLELRGVTHKYRQEGDEREFHLGPVDLSVAAGEMVFVTGGNGSGKTTLVKVMTGLYVPEAGEIVLNGRRVDDDTREWYSQHFAAIFSDCFLFDSLLGLEATAPDLDATAREYLRLLQLDQRVDVRDGVLSTIKVSQGQKKRLALLTSYLEDRPIYVFDEWAADQDPEFRKVFYRQLLPHLKARGKTVIVISHDEQFYDIADRVLRLDAGALAPLTGVHFAECGVVRERLASMAQE